MTVLEAARPRLPVRTWGLSRGLSSLPLLAALLVLWQLFGGDSMSAFGSPTGVLRATRELMSDGTLVKAILVSWATVLRGFLVATALGVSIGTLIGYSEQVRTWIEPIIDGLRPIAPFAWIPLAILWFGTSGNTGVMITAYAAFFPIVTNTMTGVSRIRGSLIHVARTLGAGGWTTFRRVVFPGSLPLMIVGLRLGLGLAWAAVIAAELATGKSTTAAPGIGYLLYLNFATVADSNAIITMMIAIGVSALLTDWGARKLQARFVFWRTEQ